MNGKPQLVLGQAQFTGASPQMAKSQYTKPSLMPVGNGNSFASILSSTVNKSGGGENLGVKGAMKGMLPGGQRTFLGNASSTLFSENVAPATPQGKSVTKIGGTTVQATNQATAVSQRVSTIPKNYSFGMEDTRARSVKKMPAVASASPSARSINIAAIQSRSNKSAPVLVDQLAAKNGVIRETPYRGLSLSQEGMDKNVLASLNSGKGGKNSFVSPLLAGGSTQLIMQLVKEVGYVVSTVSDRLQLKEPVALARPVVDQKRPAYVETKNQPSRTQASGLTQAQAQASKTSLSRPSVATSLAQQSETLVAGPSLAPLQGNSLGDLAAKFESGDSGIAAIGYDRHGGTSYGKYQISSRAGTFSKFMDYLDINGPDIAAKLREGGAANTGGRNGKMPNIWRSIAAAEPERFEELQTDFIMSSHFQPAVSAIAEATGVAFNAMPEALREVVFSTAVQHGVSGAARIISRAVASVGADNLTANEEVFVDRTGQDLIRQIYAIRARQFSSSTSTVRSAVQNRLQHEMRDALTLLQTTDIQETPDTRRVSATRG